MANYKGLYRDQLINRKVKFQRFNLDGILGETIGEVERTGSWIIYGDSGQGKTNFAIDLAHELARHAKVAYISLEEGMAGSFTENVKVRNGEPVKKKIIFYEFLDYITLLEMLAKRKSPNIIFIDSLQYFEHTENDESKVFTLWHYRRLREKYPRKMFIFVSHQEGKKPDGRLGKKILYDANVKVNVKDGVAYIKSRYKRGKEGQYNIFS